MKPAKEKLPRGISRTAGGKFRVSVGKTHLGTFDTRDIAMTIYQAKTKPNNSLAQRLIRIYGRDYSDFDFA
jgi:hypothetical protein